MDNSCDEWNDIHVWHMMVCFGHNKMPGPKNGIQEWYTADRHYAVVRTQHTLA